MSLQERIRAGDWAVFADPALPLHLLQEPTAPWLVAGLELACLALGREVSAAELPELLGAWTTALLQETSTTDPAALRLPIAQGMTMLRMAAPQEEPRQRALGALLRAVVEPLGARAAPALLALARRLRARLPAAPAGLDEMLTALRWMSDSDAGAREA